MRVAASFVCRYDWYWWCHLTFRTPPTWDWAVSAFSRWMNKLNRSTFGNNYYKRPNEGLRWLRGVERQQLGARHFHVLVAGSPKLHRDEATRLWGKLAGNAQIDVYDPTRGAAIYIVKKYAAEGNLDLGGPWTCIPTKLSGVVQGPTRGS